MKKKLLIVVPSLLLFLLFLFWITLPDVSGYKKGRVKSSAFMELRKEQAKDKGLKRFRIYQRYVPLRRISKYLISAVLIAEDDAFYSHKGFDWNGIRTAMEKNMRNFSFSAGGSTITQQVAKNLFLSPSKSLFRKGREALITWKLENQLSKRRILEIYLNIAEWGNGIFGAEAAARRFFRTSAAGLKLYQGAALACMLPYPPKKRLSKSSYRRILVKTGIILRRMVKKRLISRQQYRDAAGKARFFLNSLRKRVPAG